MDNRALYVAFFQSPSTSKRRAIIMTDLPRKKTDLQYLVVEMIEKHNLPQDSVLGDIMKLEKTAIDDVQDWIEYKSGLESIYEVCIDSMRLPKLNSNKFYDPDEFIPETSNYTPYDKKNTMLVGKYPDTELRRVVIPPKDGI